MAWEKRRGTEARYYYRSSRRNGRVVKEYVGCGPQAAAQAEEAEQARLAHQSDRAAAKELASALEPLDRLMDELHAGIGSLAEATLLAAGCYKHHGAWRRKHAHQRPTSSQS